MSWRVSPARVIAFTPKNIKAGFAASSLFPFNPERVLRSMPNSAESAIPRADEVNVGSCRQDVELETPVTPVSAEAFMSLQNLIIQRDARALDERSRRSTKSLVLGKAKVMSYEDLEEARAKRLQVTHRLRCVVIDSSPAIAYDVSPWELLEWRKVLPCESFPNFIFVVYVEVREGQFVGQYKVKGCTKCEYVGFAVLVVSIWTGHRGHDTFSASSVKGYISATV